MLPPERRTKMSDLKSYYQVKLSFLTILASFIRNPPKNKEEKEFYDIVQKAYYIILNKIDVLEGKDQKLLKDYYKYLVFKSRKVEF